MNAGRDLWLRKLGYGLAKVERFIKIIGEGFTFSTFSCESSQYYERYEQEKTQRPDPGAGYSGRYHRSACPGGKLEWMTKIGEPLAIKLARRTALTGAHAAQPFPGIDAGVMAVIPDETYADATGRFYLQGLPSHERREVEDLGIWQFIHLGMALAGRAWTCAS